MSDFIDFPCEALPFLRRGWGDRGSIGGAGRGERGELWYVKLKNPSTSFLGESPKIFPISPKYRKESQFFRITSWFPEPASVLVTFLFLWIKHHDQGQYSTHHLFEFVIQVR